MAIRGGFAAMRHALAAGGLLAGLALAGCASGPPAAPPPPLLDDGLFGPPSEPVDTSRVFALSESMQRYVGFEIAEQLRSKGAQAGLIEALYRRGQLKLEYDAARTRTASEAFDARAGNCLSLVIMTAAFAKALNLQVNYQSALIDETWSRDGSLLFASGHVNIIVGRRLADFGSGRDLQRLMVDFLPPEDLERLRTRPIAEETVVAMFANNRAAEALAADRLDDAYAWARAGLASDPAFAGAWNTLGVVYLRHGDAGLAERVFRHVIGHEAKNKQAIANLADLLERQGRAAEAAPLKARLAELEAYPPFHFFDLGLAAMQRHDYRTARELFAREVGRAEHYHEFQFWLALADWQLGDTGSAREHLALAREASTTRGQHELYAAKLEWLNAQRH